MSDLIVDTNQEAFDFVVRHFIHQRTRSMDALGLCMYRAPDGKRCAVGALIKDGSYSPAMEGLGAVSVFCSVGEDRKQLEVGNVNVNMLGILQYIHDNAATGLVVATVMQDLREAAVKYNLDTTVLETEYAPLTRIG